MSFRFITSVLSAGALIATLTAAPARAQNHDEIGRFVGAAATLFILGKIIESERSKKKQVHVQQTHKPKAHAPAPKKPQKQVVTPRRSNTVVTPRHSGQGAGRAPLPRQCMIPVNGGGTLYVMGRRCLENNYRSAQRLPQSCLITLRGARHDRPVYSVRCLRNRGYTLARN